MPKGKWEPPESGDAPKEVKDILRTVYSKYRDENPAEDDATKEKGAKIAWGAVKSAGWEMGKDGKWTRNLKESLSNSFNEIRNKVDAALRAHPSFPEKVGERSAYVYIQDINSSTVVVEYMNDKYAVPYSMLNDTVILGQPEKVKEVYVVKESNITDLKESRACDFLDYVNISEADVSADGSKVKAVLIECGTNELKRRHYPDKTIRESAAGFAGLKMYINHPTPQEEAQRPERDLKDWVATITESEYENGKVIGTIAVHDTWLRERLADPVARNHIGLSINTGGKVAMGKINGKDYQIVEKIVFARKNGPVSVDWVTEAGARGRVLSLIESQRKENSMPLENVTLVELKEARKDLVESIAKDAVAPIQTKLAEAEAKLVEAQSEIKSLKESKTLEAQTAEVGVLLKEAKIPEASKSRIAARFTSVVANIKESVASAIKDEMEYVNKLSSTGKIKIEGSDSQNSASLMESLSAELEERAGVKTEKK